jgi:O-antigen biosynthesis protein
VDYCLKLRKKGLRHVFTPYAELVHYESASRVNPGRVRDEELEAFHSRWWNDYYQDPYYNPNLPVDFPYYAASE